MPSTGSEYTIEKKFENPEKATLVVEDRPVTINTNPTHSVTDQIGRGTSETLRAAFDNPIMKTSTEVLTSSKKKPEKKKLKLLSKLQFQ